MTQHKNLDGRDALAGLDDYLTRDPSRTLADDLDDILVLGIEPTNHKFVEPINPKTGKPYLDARVFDRPHEIDLEDAFRNSYNQARREERQAQMAARYPTLSLMKRIGDWLADVLDAGLARWNAAGEWFIGLVKTFGDAPVEHADGLDRFIPLDVTMQLMQREVDRLREIERDMIADQKARRAKLYDLQSQISAKEIAIASMGGARAGR